MGVDVPAAGVEPPESGRSRKLPGRAVLSRHFVLFFGASRPQNLATNMLKNILILLLVGVLVYVFMDNRTKTDQINEVETRNEALGAEIRELRERMGPTAANVPRAGQPAEALAAAPAGTTFQSVTCRLCNGTGKIEKKSLSGSVRPVPCTICGGRGKKDLQLPAGAVVCTTCGGVGRVADGKALSGFSNCDKCRGQGFTR